MQNSTKFWWDSANWDYLQIFNTRSVLMLILWGTTCFHVGIYCDAHWVYHRSTSPFPKKWDVTEWTTVLRIQWNECMTINFCLWVAPHGTVREKRAKAEKERHKPQKQKRELLCGWQLSHKQCYDVQAWINLFAQMVHNSDQPPTQTPCSSGPTITIYCPFSKARHQLTQNHPVHLNENHPKNKFAAYYWQLTMSCLTLIGHVKALSLGTMPVAHGGKWTEWKIKKIAKRLTLWFFYIMATLMPMRAQTHQVVDVEQVHPRGCFACGPVRQAQAHKTLGCGELDAILEEWHRVTLEFNATLEDSIFFKQWTIIQCTCILSPKMVPRWKQMMSLHWRIYRTHSMEWIVLIIGKERNNASVQVRMKQSREGTCIDVPQKVYLKWADRPTFPSCTSANCWNTLSCYLNPSKWAFEWLFTIYVCPSLQHTSSMLQWMQSIVRVHTSKGSQSQAPLHHVCPSLLQCLWQLQLSLHWWGFNWFGRSQLPWPTWFSTISFIVALHLLWSSFSTPKLTGVHVATFTSGRVW